MVTIRSDLPPLPDRMKHLPLDSRGFPVPWFVHWDNGVPDFRVVGPGKLVDAYKRNKCWICGGPKGRFHAFLIGPMCAVNRTTSEPPSHYDCALFAAKGCPFMTRPRMRRNEKDLPEARYTPGIHLDRNPGACCLWVTREYKPFKAGKGVLFEIGEPTSVEWFCEGRKATRAVVEASVESGLPHLTKLAEAEGPEALKDLARFIERYQPFLPAA